MLTVVAQHSAREQLRLAIDMTARRVRYCRCGARLARDNQGVRCAPCEVAGRSELDAAPAVPGAFWEEPVVRQALASRHMGRLIRAWRTHPYHGRHPFPQERVAGWMGITQAQLSRIENGPRMVHLDRLIQWARLLHIPQHLLWFALPTTEIAADELEIENVRRRDLLALAAATTTGGLTHKSVDNPISGSGEAAEWLAWEMWTHRVQSIHESQVPPAIAKPLAGLPICIRDGQGFYRLTQQGMTDTLVAQRILRDLSDGSSHLLASAQTSHQTDLVLAHLAGRESYAARPLTAWAEHGPSTVLRVNASGILAKTGSPDVGDTVISILRHDPDTRYLYLTAVANRVLALPWPDAERLANAANTGHATTAEVSPDRENAAVARLAVEIRNPRDAAARWCSIILLGAIRDQRADVVASALRTAVSQETCRENLRAIAAVLAGNDPVSI